MIWPFGKEPDAAEGGDSGGGTPDTPPAPEAASPPAPAAPVSPAAPKPPLTMDEAVGALEANVDAFPGVLADKASLKAWLAEFRAPLLSIGVNEFASALSYRVRGMSRGRLRELYTELTPDELNAVVAANAAAFGKLASAKAREAAVLQAMHEKLADSAASMLASLASKVVWGVI